VGDCASTVGRVLFAFAGGDTRPGISAYAAHPIAVLATSRVNGVPLAAVVTELRCLLWCRSVAGGNTLPGISAYAAHPVAVLAAGRVNGVLLTTVLAEIPRKRGLRGSNDTQYRSGNE